MQKSVISNAGKTPRKQKTPHAQDSRKSKLLSMTENRTAVAWGGGPVRGTRGVERIVRRTRKLWGERGLHDLVTIMITNVQLKELSL